MRPKPRRARLAAIPVAPIQAGQRRVRHTLRD